jgi:hypothetical protein
MNNLRACWRLLRVLGHILKGLPSWRCGFRRCRPTSNMRACRPGRCSCWPVRACPAHPGHAAREWAGDAGRQPHFVARYSGHARGAALPFCLQIGRAGWPLVGTLATAAGTLYIERNSRRDALRMVRSMHEALERGEVLAVFPEGTTGDGRAMLPFHANLLQAAVTADAFCAAGGPALCRQGHGHDQFCAQLHRRRNPGGLHLAHPARARHRGRGALRRARARRACQPWLRGASLTGRSPEVQATRVQIRYKFNSALRRIGEGWSRFDLNDPA